MVEIHQTKAVDLAARASFDRLRQDQQRASAGVALVLEKLAESAFGPAFRLKDLPRSCGLTPSWLWRHFEIEVGATPKGYLTRMRLETAQVLLEDEQPPVAQVAAWVGYRSVEVFITAFRIWAQETPGAYRLRRLQAKAQRPAALLEPPEQPLSAEDLELEETAADLLAEHWLHFTPEERREIIKNGFTVSPQTLIEVAIEESCKTCDTDPLLALRLAQVALDSLQESRAELHAATHRQLRAEALRCLSTAAHAREETSRRESKSIGPEHQAG